MLVHLFDCPIAGIPSELILLEEVTVRLVEDSECGRFDEELATKHYPKNATAVRRVLRYVAEYRGQWVALLTFNSAAYHLKLREQWLHWVAPQVSQHRHLLAQNSRFFVLGAPGQCPIKLLGFCIWRARDCPRTGSDAMATRSWPSGLS